MSRFEEIKKVILDEKLVQFFFEYYNEENESYNYFYPNNIDSVNSTEDVLFYLKKWYDIEDFEVISYQCNSDEMYCIVYFKNEDIYIKLEGEYDSYGGNDHSYFYGEKRITQVFPKKIEVIIYE